MLSVFFFFNDTATTEIYTLSLHDALPISYTSTGATSAARCLNESSGVLPTSCNTDAGAEFLSRITSVTKTYRSEEHTSELQLRQYLVCRLLLEKKKISYTHSNTVTHSCLC